MRRNLRNKPYSLFEHEQFIQEDRHNIEAQRQFSAVQMLKFYDPMPKMVRDIAKDDTRAILDFWGNFR